MCVHSFTTINKKLLALFSLTAASCQHQTASNLWHYATIDHPRETTFRGG